VILFLLFWLIRLGGKILFFSLISPVVTSEKR
jgi:hypothetical protein